MGKADEEESKELQRRFQAGSGASDGAGPRPLSVWPRSWVFGGSFSTSGATSFEAGGRAGLERRRGRPPGSKSQTVSPPAPSAAELRIAELERLLGRKQLEVDFLKRAFEQVRGAASIRTSDGGKESIARSKSRSRSKE